MVAPVSTGEQDGHGLEPLFDVIKERIGPAAPARPAAAVTTPAAKRPKKPRQKPALDPLTLVTAQLVSAPATAATGRAWTLALPWSSPPWSLNDRFNRFEEAKLKATIRTVAHQSAKSQRIGRLERCRVCLHVLPAQSRVRDAENPAPTLKTICDGLVDAGVVDDDDTWRMVKEMPVIYMPIKGQPARLWMTIEELEPVATAPAARSKPTSRPAATATRAASATTTAAAAAPTSTASSRIRRDSVRK